MCHFLWMGDLDRCRNPLGLVESFLYAKEWEIFNLSSTLPFSSSTIFKDYNLLSSTFASFIGPIF
jgi:hypothetical protein